MNKKECLKLYNERIIELMVSNENVRIINSDDKVEILFHKESVFKIYKNGQYVMELDTNKIVKKKSERSFKLCYDNDVITIINLPMNYVRIEEENELIFRLNIIDFDKTMQKILTDQFVYGRETKYPKLSYNIMTENEIDHTLIIKLQTDIVSQPIEIINIKSENIKLLESQQTLFSLNSNRYINIIADIIEHGVENKLVLMNNNIYSLFHYENQIIKLINVVTQEICGVSLLDFVINMNPCVISNINQSVYVPSEKVIIKANKVSHDATIISDNMDIINKRLEILKMLSNPILRAPENEAILANYETLLEENNKIIKANKELYDFIINNKVVIYKENAIDISAGFLIEQ